MKLCGVLSKSVWRGYRIQRMASAYSTRQNISAFERYLILKLQIPQTDIKEFTLRICIWIVCWISVRGLQDQIGVCYSVSGRGVHTPAFSCRYLLDNPIDAQDGAIGQAGSTFTEIIELPGRHLSMRNTHRSINECHAVARVNDYRNEKLLDWYVEE